MEDPEVPTEHLHEEMHHQAHGAKESWVMWVALSSAIIAALAALASLNAGHYANEAVVTQIESANKQIEAANQWSYFQSKSIKESQLRGKMDLVALLGKDVSDKDKSKVAEYSKEKGEIQHSAEHLQAEAGTLQVKAGSFMHRHEVIAKSVTLFQVAIAVSAISVLTQRRRYWILSLVFGAVGIFFLVQGLFFTANAAHANSGEGTHSAPRVTGASAGEKPESGAPHEPSPHN